jgi:hypothetical protein
LNITGHSELNQPLHNSKTEHSGIELSSYLDENGNPLNLKSEFAQSIREDSLLPDAIQEYDFTGTYLSGEFGTSVAFAGDVNADGYDDIIIGAPHDGTNGIDAGRTFIYFGGPVVNFTPDVILAGQNPNEQLGSYVSSAGDVNNDGYDDVIVAGGYNSGKVFIYFGGGNMNNSADVIFTGPLYFGNSLSCAGDVNDDGYSDVLIGSYWESRAFLFFGGITMDNIADQTFYEPNSEFGTSVAGAGDLNGDGYGDFIIGDRYTSSGNMNSNGSASIYYGGITLDNIPDLILYGANSFDNFGISVSSAGDVNRDGFSDVIVGAYRYNGFTGRAYIFFGGSIMNSIPDVILTGEQSYDHFGQSVSGAGDLNGDGYDDVIVGAHQIFQFATDPGKAYTFYGGQAMDNIADNIFSGESAVDGLGCSVAAAGDFNNDGFDDLLVGAYRNDNGGPNAGKAYLYTNTVNSTQDPMLTFDGNSPSRRLGWSVSDAGDVNGDGYADMIIGSGNLIQNQPALVYYGGRFTDNIPDVSLYASEYGSFRVASAGDVNNDGYDDIITSDPHYPQQYTDIGAAYIFFGGTNMSGLPDVTLYGVAVNDFFGFSISTAGDVNNDGYDDVIVGAPNNESYEPDAGTAYIYFGGSSMDNVADVAMNGEAMYDRFGYSVSNGGKLNTDGFGDVLVGAPRNSAGGGAAGRVYLYYGGASMNNNVDLIMTGTNYQFSQSQFGWSVESTGDVNGDSYDDFIAGALTADLGSGRAYIYFGGSFLDNFADVTLRGENNSYQFGGSLAAPGDLNKDGYNDIIVGESANSTMANQMGRISVYYGGGVMNAVADRVIYGEAANNLFGYSVSGAGDVDGDGVNEFIASSPNSNSSAPLGGKVYMYKPSESGTDIKDKNFVGAPGDQYGYSVSTAGDINADGYDDVIVGSLYNDGTGTDAGAAYIYFGGAVLDYYPDVFLYGAAAYDHFGTSVSYAGDVNQDGYPDVIVGAPENDAAGIDAGRAYIYFGGPGMNNVADVILTGQAPGDRFGFSVSRAGNVNGDAAGDVIVGAVFNDAGGTNAGRAYVYFGGTSMNNLADVIITGAGAGYWLGISCSYAGNVNGDFYDDVIVGASMHDVPGPGQAYVYLGSPSMDNIPDVTMTGEWESDQFGYSVSTAGNVNGDNYTDVIVGAYGNNEGGEDAGRAYIYHGSAVMNGSADVVLTGAQPFDFFGVSVSAAGSINSDPYEDVIVGACYNDAGGQDAGRAYVFYGGVTMNNVADLLMTGKFPYDNFGWSVGYAGDLNLDNRSDLIIGANLNDAGGNNAGKSYIYLNSDPVNQLILTLRLIPEGFFNSNLTNLNMSDTVTISLHNQNFPYNQIDITKGIISKITFEGRFFFAAAPEGSYYVRVRHRNSIDTWSFAPIRLVKNTNVNYNFTDEAFRAFGFNQKIVNNSPLLFGIYSGDVNRDGTVDATDVSLVDNDALNFVTGYVVTDLSGDYYVDGADFLIADNNAGLFATVIQP